MEAYEKVDPIATPAGAEHSAEVDDLVAELRETHRRRPRLQEEFDRAGLT